MCCFSRPVKHVSATRIFARHVDEDRQALVYSMSLEVDEELAMVLPLPVEAAAPEDAVSFVDLSGYPKFFDDLADAFPVRPAFGRARSKAQAASLPRATLPVHDVGDFVASYVPSPRDFHRLDTRFRLSPAFFSARAEYADYGFAVFQLKPKTGGWFRKKLQKQTVHPMAFTFPSRRPKALFFPTLHVHDGDVPAEATFDHTLYCQTSNDVMAKTFPFERSSGPLGRYVDETRAGALVDSAGFAYRNVVVHDQPNIDFWYSPPNCSGPEVLSFEDELFEFRLSATAAYYMKFGHRPARKWHHAATHKLDAVSAALRDGCRALTREHRDAWHLIPIRSETDPASLSNGAVWGNTPSGWGPLEPGAERAVRVSIFTDGEEIEPQTVDVAFGRVPSPALVREIQDAVNGFVRAAVAD
jgi:hypothetical protein